MGRAQRDAVRQGRHRRRRRRRPIGRGQPRLGTAPRPPPTTGCRSPPGATATVLLRLPTEPLRRSVRRRRRRVRAPPRRGRRVLRRRSARTGTDRGRAARPAPGLRRPALEQAVLSLRRREWLDGDPAGPPPPAERAARPQPDWRTSTTPTSSRCPTPGSTPGSRPGTWPSTASRWRMVDPEFAKRQLLLADRASGTCTRTARCRPTSGPSAT